MQNAWNTFLASARTAAQGAAAVPPPAETREQRHARIAARRAQRVAGNGGGHGGGAGDGGHGGGNGGGHGNGGGNAAAGRLPRNSIMSLILVTAAVISTTGSFYYFVIKSDPADDNITARKKMDTDIVGNLARGAKNGVAISQTETGGWKAVPLAGGTQVPGSQVASDLPAGFVTGTNFGVKNVKGCDIHRNAGDIYFITQGGCMEFVASPEGSTTFWIEVPKGSQLSVEGESQVIQSGRPGHELSKGFVVPAGGRLVVSRRG